MAFLPPVMTLLSLGMQGTLALLVLCRLVGLVLATLLEERLESFRNVHHACQRSTSTDKVRPDVKLSNFL